MTTPVTLNKQNLEWMIDILNRVEDPENTEYFYSSLGLLEADVSMINFDDDDNDFVTVDKEDLEIVMGENKIPSRHMTDDEIEKFVWVREHIKDAMLYS